MGWQAVRDAARGHWLEILPRLAPELGPAVERVGQHVPCPIHGGKDGFRFFENAIETGGGICNTCGSFSTGFKILAWVRGCSEEQAVEAVREQLNGHVIMPEASRPPSSAKPSTPTRRYSTEAELEAIWRPARVGDERLRQYFQARGLSVEPPETLRVHPGLTCWETRAGESEVVGNFPTILARVETLTGDLIALQKTHLARDEAGKAEVEAPKKSTRVIENQTLTGAAIHLYPLTGSTLALAEGIETACAVHQAVGVPAWSTVSAHGLATVELPASVRTVHIWADNDESHTGQEAAEKAAERLTRAGHTIFVYVPPKPGTDWLDVLGTDGEPAFWAAVEATQPWKARTSPSPTHDSGSDPADAEASPPRLLPDPELEPLEADAADDPNVIRLTEAEARALVGQVTYYGLAQKMTDIIVATWVARWFGDRLRLAPVEPAARWWDGSHWLDDQDRGRFGQCVRLTTRFLQASAALVEIPPEILDGKVAALQKKAKGLGAEAVARLAETRIRQDLADALLPYRNRSKLVAVEALVQSHPPVRIGIERFDADRWLLNVANGTIDLTTSTLRAHDPADLITRVIDIAYDPEAECPRFLQFLAELFPEDAALRDFLQVFIGSCLTGDVSAQLLVVFVGGGSNGKSTLLRILERLIGPYFRTLQPVVLLDDAKGHSSSSERMHEYARLKGVRLAVVFEPPEGDQLSEGAMKYLTGGDPITGRHLFKKAFEYLPSHKLLLVCNDAPAIRGQGVAVWRRPKFVPFKQHFWKASDPDFTEKPPDAPMADLDLLDTLMTELPGILRWAVEGARQYKQSGLPTLPEAIRTTTQEHRDEQDALGDFLAECTEREADAWTEFEKLYGRFIEWRKAGLQMKPDAAWTPDLSQTAFGRLLAQHGFASKRARVDTHHGARQVRGRSGLRLRDGWTPA